MKSPQPVKPKAAKLPKARAMFAHNYGNTKSSTEILHKSTKWGKIIPCALIPTRTQKQARELVKVANMTHEERVEYAQASLMEKNDLFVPYDDIRLVLSVLGLGGPS